MKTGGAATSPMAQWLSPTLDPKALDERIEQLQTVQFWLEQNTRMLQASIQALEVQRMTLATLESMNVPVSQWAQAFSAPTGSAAPAPGPGPAPATGAGAGQAQASSAAVDPMQWWSALTRQFSALASQAVASARAVPSSGAAPGAGPVPGKKQASPRKRTARRRSTTPGQQ